MNAPKDFFVGYLPPSLQVRRDCVRLLVVLLLTALLVALFASGLQRSSGMGTWDLSQERRISGYLTLDPYPVLHYVGKERHAVILVQEGKYAATTLAEPYAGRWVSVSGHAIERGDWRMLELSAEAAFEPLNEHAFPPPDVAPKALDQVELTGEIIDSKCFLGAMKPGAGKAHRACAWLCLAGGIPPMFVVKSANGDAAGEYRGFLLVDNQGHSAAEQLARHVATPLRLSGTLETRGTLPYIRLHDAPLAHLAAEELADYGATIFNDADNTLVCNSRTRARVY